MTNFTNHKSATIISKKTQNMYLQADVFDIAVKQTQKTHMNTNFLEFSLVANGKTQWLFFYLLKTQY